MGTDPRQGQQLSYKILVLDLAAAMEKAGKPRRGCGPAVNRYCG
jgi:hypothetical protein